MALITLNKLALPTGSVVQVVQSIDVTNRTITSTSLASTGISLSITPSSSSNKILLRCYGIFSLNVPNRRQEKFAFYRDTTSLIPSGVNAHADMTNVEDDFNYSNQTFAIEYLDSPATTSSITYNIYASVNSSTMYIGRRGFDTSNDSPTMFTATEIKA
tara:strand:+ start:451 stop:927 length:477 start_codon:yes stop_codon:yes gene_type:complete